MEKAYEFLLLFIVRPGEMILYVVIYRTKELKLQCFNQYYKEIKEPSSREEKTTSRSLPTTAVLEGLQGFLG